MSAQKSVRESKDFVSNFISSSARRELSERVYEFFIVFFLATFGETVTVFIILIIIPKMKYFAIKSKTLAYTYTLV